MSSCPYDPNQHQDPKNPNVMARKDLTYNEYLKVNELLELQVQQSDPPHHDELLFIIIHQSYELWFKLIRSELKQAFLSMQKGEVLQAHHFVKRSVEVLKLLVQQIHILETMRPVDFMEFRDRLMPASGFQSTQFREIEFFCGLKDPQYLKYFDNKPEQRARLEAQFKEPDLRDAYLALLHQQGFKVPANARELEASADPDVRAPIHEALREVYQWPDLHLPLYLLCESLVEVDQYLALWREHHVRVVERVIGFKKGTGGSSGVEYLRSTLGKKCFPSLWEVRTKIVRSADAPR